MTKTPRLHPLLVLLLWLIAAFVVIWTGPMLIPAANSVMSADAVLWKIFGSFLFFAASVYFFRRSETGPEILGLKPTARHATWLFAGSIGGVLGVALFFAFLRCITSFHFESGTILPGQFGLSILAYLFGALLEELAFRGYPLLRLRDRYGPVKGVLAVSLAFGVLHLPGMYGTNAIKIMVTTGLSSIIFSIAYLRSRTLWCAVGLHMGMNVTLHSLLGGGGGRGSSVLVTKFDQPASFDAGFWMLTLTLLLMITIMISLWPRASSTIRKAELKPA